MTEEGVFDGAVEKFDFVPLTEDGDDPLIANDLIFLADQEEIKALETN